MSDISFSEILDEVSEYLKDNILAEDFLNIEEDVIEENPVYYIVLDSVDEKGKVSSERVCTVYPSVLKPQTYDASSVAEIFSAAFLFLRVLDEKFNSIDKEAVELKALKQLLKLSLGNLLKMETKILKLVKPEDAKKEGVDLNDFESYWKFIEGIIGTFDEEVQFSFAKKATSENKIVATGSVEEKPQTENKPVVDMAAMEKIKALEEETVKIVESAKAEPISEEKKGETGLEKKINAEEKKDESLEVELSVPKDSAKDDTKDALEKPESVLETESNKHQTLTTEVGAGTSKSSVVEVNVDKPLGIIIGLDFSNGKDSTAYTELKANNTHFSQEMLAVSK